MDDGPETNLAYYEARAAIELERALGAPHPKAAEAHHALAFRYLDLVKQLALEQELAWLSQGAAAAGPSPAFG